MRRTLTALALLAALAPLPAPADSHGTAEPALLTIVGGSESNRGAIDPSSDVLMAFRDLSFDKAFTLTRSDLMALEQVRVTADAPGWPEPVEATGPSLDAVLAAAGMPEEATILISAFDGYEAEITAEERAVATWVVALESDGKPLGNGGRGPLWFLKDTGGVEATDEEEAKWVWAAYFVRMVEPE